MIKEVITMKEKPKMLKVFKPFINVNIEKSEEWLSQMAKSGWRLMNVNFDKYYFKEAEPKNLKYAILVSQPKSIDLRVFELATTMTTKWKAIKIPVSGSACSRIYSYDESIDDRKLKFKRNKLLVEYRKGFFIVESIFVLMLSIIYIFGIGDRIGMIADIPIFLLIVAMWANNLITLLNLRKYNKKLSE